MQIEIDLELFRKSEKRVWVKPTANRKGYYRKVNGGQKKGEEVKESTYVFNRYLKSFGSDVKISDSETGVGIINLYHRAANKKEIILDFLNRKYGDEFQFKGDFFAGLSRIEFIKRKNL